MSIRSGSLQKKIREASLRKLPTVPLPDPYLDRILAEETEFLNIINIRDELIDNALNQCYDEYIKIQSAKFFVDCLHQAYIKMINTIHMHFDKTVLDSLRDLWTSEPEFYPLPSDNYSEFSVPFENDEEICRDKSVVYEVEQSENDDIPTEREYTWHFHEDEYKDHPCETSISMYETVTPVLVSDQEEVQVSLATDTSELFEEVSTEASFFTTIAEAEQNLLPPIENLRCNNSMIRSGDNIPQDKAGKSNIDYKSDITPILPPLRLKAKFRANECPKSSVRFGRSALSFDGGNTQSSREHQSSNNTNKK